MRGALKLHPDCRCDAVTRIEVNVIRRRPQGLTVRYAVSGEIGALSLPAKAAPTRTDELWKHTCFEAFLRPAPGPGYLELNFAPSTEWAAYRFTGYREGMAPVAEIAAPRIEMRASGTRAEMLVSVEIDGVPDLTGGMVWQVGLAAVIEEKNGALSYWALAHPPGKPDFHHPDCFAFELPAA